MDNPVLGIGEDHVQGAGGVVHPENTRGGIWEDK